jgi:hypothetical protein
MKKIIKTLSLIIALLISLSLLGVFASCNAEISNEDVTEPTDNAESPTEAPTEKPTEEVKVDPPVEISAEMESEIKNKYIEFYYDENDQDYYNKYLPDMVKIEACYGIFDDAYCLMLDHPKFLYTCAVTEVEVGEYTFVFSDGNTMKVYCNGEFYGLKQAYENGILDDAELESLYNYYTKTRGW